MSWGCLSMMKNKKKEEKLYLLQDDRNHPDRGRTPEEIAQGMKEAREWLDQDGRREYYLSLGREK